MINRQLISAGILSLLFLASCGEREAQRQLVNEVVQEQLLARIRNYKEIRYRKCLEEMYRQAGEIADSLLLMEARQTRDSTGKPIVPLKPGQPEIKVFADTVPIAPFLPEDTTDTNNLR